MSFSLGDAVFYIGPSLQKEALEKASLSKRITPLKRKPFTNSSILDNSRRCITASALPSI